MMQETLRPIRSEPDYDEALRVADSLMDAEPGTPESDRLEVLAALIEDYEEKHFPIDAPDPIEAIKFRMEQRGLRPVDLQCLLVRRAVGAYDQRLCSLSDAGEPPSRASHLVPSRSIAVRME